ncbi:MAG TPA: hypothetical protein VEQ63_07425 [Bryobacteraceae bacterium]|nr:hypothetical protein [Bryobacteraceae bacterium]
MNKALSHPVEAELLAAADRELAGTPSQGVLRHIESCADCRVRVGELRAGLDAYLNEQEAAKRTALQTPVIWADLKPRMRSEERVITIRPAPRRIASWVPAAVAASLLIGTITFWKRSETVVSAAELLDRAVKAPSAAVAQRRPLRVKTRTALYVRPAVGESKDVRLRRIGAMLEASGFDWEDPFSAKAFADWRNGLRVKSDRVRIESRPDGRHYEIRTQTEEGSLSEALITLRASDLRPVREVLRFQNEESIEIEEVLGEVTAEPQVSSTPVPSAPAGVVRTVGASEELRVIAALHHLGADLGEPVEVTRSENGSAVVVTGLGLSSQRQIEISRAVADLPYVEFRFSSPESSPAAPPGSQARIARGRNRELEAWLLQRIGSAAALQEIAEQSLDASEMALAHAHALRSLKRRFPATAEWSTEDQELLRQIETNHHRNLAELAKQLRTALLPIVGEIRSERSSSTQDLVQSAQGLDQLLTTAFAASTSSDPDALFEQIGKALADFMARVEVRA